MLITEAAGPNKLEDFLRGVGHLSANLLKEELVQFNALRGYLPRVVVIPIAALYENEIREEIARVAEQLGVDISLGYEDVKVAL